MKQHAMDYLMQDALANINILEALELPAAKVLRADETGVLVEYDGLYFLAAEPGQASAFLPLMTQGLAKDTTRQIVVRGKELIPSLTHDYSFAVVMECCHAVYASREPLHNALPQGAAIRPLDLSHFDIVRAHYHTVDNANYLRERIANGMFGVFFGDELAGFIGTHEERPMGLLEVLPDYRRLGLAYALEAHLINHLLSLGRTPFCQVALHNEPSFALQKKLGLTISDTMIYWLDYIGS
jgi:GNAT superfamily N-acetyltransferase